MTAVRRFTRLWRWGCAGCRSSTSRAVINRSRTRTALSAWFRTGRFTRFPDCATRSPQQVIDSRPARTRRSLEGLLSRLNGMFAFALHDERGDRVYLVRDRLGIKPLLYTIRDGVLYFGSALSALFASGAVPVVPDPIGVRLYLHLQFIPTPFTAISGVKKVPPASYLAVENGRIRGPVRYWNMPVESAMPRSLDDWADELHDLLRDAVRVHLVSDVEVGIFLSGGIDSSAVLGLMSGFTDQPVKAFSIGFEDRAGLDETPFARLAADRFGAELHHTHFTASHVLELARDVVEHMDEPNGDPACLPTFMLARNARKHVKVVLSGEGADELFAGYGYYKRVGSPVDRVKQLARDALIRFSRADRQRRAAFRLPKTFRNRSPLSGYPYAFTPDVIERLRPDLPAGFMPDIHDTTARIERSHLPANGKLDALGKALRVDNGCFLPDDLLMTVDRMTMAHSLEARVPFLDFRVVELAMRMPSEVKIRGQRDKAVLRSAFGTLLGDTIAGREKHGFSLPMGDWLSAELRPLVENSFGGKGPERCPWISADGVRAVVNAHFSGRSRFEREIWMLYVLTAWFSEAESGHSKTAASSS
ncbi:MAG: asparagine synthase (glutamine-hydrolyzing) [bacterium]